MAALKEMIKELNGHMTQSELAERCGCSRQKIGDIKNGANENTQKEHDIAETIKSLYFMYRDL